MNKQCVRIQMIVGMLIALICQPCFAVLPTPTAPTAGAAAGDWLGLIRGYIQDGGVILGLAISVIGFLWVSYAAIAKFNEARQGRAEWSEVGLLGVAAGATLLFISFLLNEAAGIF